VLAVEGKGRAICGTDRYRGFDLEDEDWPTRMQAEEIAALLAVVKAREG
jgi:hypothetical protein